MAITLPGLAIAFTVNSCTRSVACIYFVIFLLVGRSVTAEHVTGEWKTTEFYHFLTQFGFQRANPHDVKGSSGYIYGNITLKQGDFYEPNYKFVAASEEYWYYYIDQYQQKESKQNNHTCRDMFKHIDHVAYDKTCLPNGTVDMMRTIPCPVNELCYDDQGGKHLVIPGYQFTIQIGDTDGPSLWYLSMVSCYHKNTTQDQESCSWHNDNQHQDVILKYDLWLVNGDPLAKQNLFYFQFSYTLQGILGIYLAFTMFYLPLIACHTMAHSKYMHPIIKLFTLCLYVEFCGILLLFVHLIVYSQDGSGVEIVYQFGNVCDILSQCLFMLLLLLLAKGWTITTTKFTQKKLLFGVWGVYCATYGVLFLWMAIGIDETSTLVEYQTWPGAVILTLRCLIFIWFLIELRTTYRQEYIEGKLKFYRWFGIGFSIWFIYLPITVAICALISPLWRQKAISAMTLTADFISYVVLMLLFWPSRSSEYFTLGTSGDENTALLEQYSHLIEPI
ncbi:integral membrane protein GPR180-like [Ptychodera flava]|uniref:integral membrane protein GPR180-like n=1 Tax=Ptychodera flava TaxID=63121 RepID=UPI00396A1F78